MKPKFVIGIRPVEKLSDISQRVLSILDPYNDPEIIHGGTLSSAIVTLHDYYHLLVESTNPFKEICVELAFFLKRLLLPKTNEEKVIAKQLNMIYLPNFDPFLPNISPEQRTEICKAAFVSLLDRDFPLITTKIATSEPFHLKQNSPGDTPETITQDFLDLLFRELFMIKASDKTPIYLMQEYDAFHKYANENIHNWIKSFNIFERIKALKLHSDQLQMNSLM